MGREGLWVYRHRPIEKCRLPGLRDLDEVGLERCVRTFTCKLQGVILMHIRRNSAVGNGRVALKMMLASKMVRFVF